jgi:hypothetical protein
MVMAARTTSAGFKKEDQADSNSGASVAGLSTSPGLTNRFYTGLNRFGRFLAPPLTAPTALASQSLQMGPGLTKPARRGMC